MIQTSLVVKHKNVIENRLIALLVQEANQYSSTVYIEVENKKINAKSIMGMMSLGLCAGEELTVAAEGADEQTAVDNIEKFLSGQVA